MKRLHLHVSVPSIEQGIAFYSALFDTAPTVVKHDYAKWMLDDPQVNLAISSRGGVNGVDHVGIQVDNSGDLAALAARLKAAGNDTVVQVATTCCYANSDKSWVSDPAGVRWETFYTHGEATSYGEDAPVAATATASCCVAAKPVPAPAAKPVAGACC